MLSTFKTLLSILSFQSHDFAQPPLLYKAFETDVPEQLRYQPYILGIFK
uniref:Uncharacterized protein n=1 Tax=Ciona intestinalis TaxID=7719 RepID=H2XS51_CIOIN